MIVLAVTKAFGRFCIAGMTLEGEWVRPVPARILGTFQEEERFWDQREVTFQDEFIQIGDRIEIEGYLPRTFAYPNHTEDFITRSIHKIGNLNVQELLEFLERHEEGYETFKDTVNGSSGRSLCLIEIEDFHCFTDDFGTKLMSFTCGNLNLNNPHRNFGYYPVKDCRWEVLIESNAVPEMNHNRLFLCIGLATPYRGKDYPMAIGLIPDYELPIVIIN